jgi:hypothetical protein
MPASLEAAAVFSALLVPGLEIIAGYRRARVHALPRRDLYVLAQAVAVSLAWLPFAWLLGGHKAIGWFVDDTASQHQTVILGIIVLNLIVPLVAGASVGRLVDWLGSHPESRVARGLEWTGAFRPPTAWDAAWLRASLGEWAAVEIELMDGRTIGVLFDRNSAVDLSPRETRDVFCDTEYRAQDDGTVEIVEHAGIHIAGEQIRSLRFEHIAPPPEQTGDS